VSAGPTPTRVLVVDDDPGMRRVMQWALEDEGYAVVAAAGAAQAVAAAAVHSPAVVVLDYGLPDGDGASVARELRAVAADAALPIVLVTADGRASEKAERAGAVAYLHKPFDMGELVRLVGSVSDGVVGGT
jgi:DNA-binding response OmpR family regulator